MIKAQGGIFGWVSQSANILTAIDDVPGNLSSLNLHWQVYNRVRGRVSGSAGRGALHPDLMTAKVLWSCTGKAARSESQRRHLALETKVLATRG